MRLHIAIPDGPVKEEFLPRATLEMLEDNFDVTYNELGRNYTSEEMYSAIEGANVVITGWGTPTFIGGPINENNTLSLIAHTAGSVAHLVDDAVYEKGIRVISGNELFAESVAEGTLAYMLSMLRRIPDDIDDMRSGTLWRDGSVSYTRGVIGRDIGIVGYGMITKHLLRMLKPFGAKIKLYSGHPQDAEFLREYNATQATLEEVFSSSVVTLHSALTERTKGLVGKELLSLMPEGAVFINTSRGAIVKENELIEVLKEGKISAVLDVFEYEPLSLESPLRRLKNVYPLPHRAGPTNDRRYDIGLAVAMDTVRFTRGEELTLEISSGYAKRMSRGVK